MQWGSGDIDKFASAVSAQGADTILVRNPSFLICIGGEYLTASVLQAFNEPDFENESNIGAKDAAALWMQFIQPLKQNGLRLGGPAVTAAPSGKPWLTDFMAECSNCTIDFLPLHW